MKFFQEILNPLKHLGINDPQSSENNLVKWKIPLVISIIVQFITFQLLFILIDAKTLEEFVASYFAFITSIFLLFVLASFAWNRSKLFDDLINGFENITQKRQY